ncbi:MAG: hypothetical protein KJI69_03755 [Patescibacteria group bacterium]|nr:hypothetical protein [Patescibacteria group bacterium]
MKGHMQDGKFHPHTDYKKGVRKSRDQQAKIQGVKVERKARVITGSKLKDVSVSENYWGFETTGGKISRLRLGNWSDAGWHWDGDENDIIGYLVRVNKSQIDEEFIESMEGLGITFNKLKPLLMSKIKSGGSWLYEISGDNTRWHFNQDIDEGAIANEELEEMEDEYNEEQIEKISDELWNSDYRYEFEDFEEEHGEEIKKEMKEFINDSNTYQEFFDKMKDETFTYNIAEYYVLGAEAKVRDAIVNAVEKLKKEGELKPTREQRMEKQVTEGSQQRLARDVKVGDTVVRKFN